MADQSNMARGECGLNHSVATRSTNLTVKKEPETKLLIQTVKMTLLFENLFRNKMLCRNLLLLCVFGPMKILRKGFH